ncbi:MAG: NUDIX domain-containing protein [Candidatus Taylorbacteria bacterium]
MEKYDKPGIKAMCIFLYKGKTLATKGYDKNKDEVFYRLVGGGINFGEKSEEGVRREVQEELRCDFENLKLAKVTENIFTYEGKRGHEIVFVYKGDLSDKELYNKEKILIIEPYGEIEAEWILTSDVLSNKIILYPAIDYTELL